VLCPVKPFLPSEDAEQCLLLYQKSFTVLGDEFQHFLFQLHRICLRPNVQKTKHDSKTQPEAKMESFPQPQVALGNNCEESERCVL
jgi:hypothetical protein